MNANPGISPQTPPIISRTSSTADKIPPIKFHVRTLLNKSHSTNDIVMSDKAINTPPANGTAITTLQTKAQIQSKAFIIF